jgi:methyltransferase family protein
LNSHIVDGKSRGESLRLSTAPLLAEVLRTDPSLDWQMSPSEKVMVMHLVEHLKPKAAIEIGTRFGGSLEVLAKFCDRVYSLDIDPEVKDRLKDRFENVEYLIGRSEETLPSLIDRLQRENTELSFVLVDGDHSSEGVRKDLNNLLHYKPSVTLYILMHDSFNPVVRRGLRAANWAGSLYVHRVELDLVAGAVNTTPTFRGQLWGGLAIAILAPEPRSGDLEISAGSQLTYNSAAQTFRPSLIRKVASRIATWNRIPGRT